ncbi:hypothetical protein Y032_0016g3052 [Ancylostoma ceylanicum]|uniref:BHLH domain-containing protein n=3 Tax=Ancylostoma ceylanicum TaxID=53326 RepID=A0A016V5N4_9BILA|nr:hypothetical protein Y032_0016g3052 [Ancylostoma ceylanicum]
MGHALRHAGPRLRGGRSAKVIVSFESHSAMPSHQPAKLVPQKLRRNERERKRVDQVNQGFNQLRLRVPRPNGSKQKLSKVETLREAARYIEQLRAMLQQGAYEPQPSQRVLIRQQQHYYHANDISPYYAPVDCKPDISPASSYYSDCSFEEQKYGHFMQ